MSTTGKGLLFAAVALVLILLNRWKPYDPSVGETKPKWTDKATYPKAYVHFIGGYAGAAFLWQMGLPPVWILGILFPAAVAYEWSQRFFNGLDIIAGWAGACLFVILLLFLPYA